MELPRAQPRTLRTLRKKFLPRWLDLQARRQFRDVIMRRLGIARSHRPMLLVQNPELAVTRLLRPIVAHELLAKRDFTFLQIGAYDGVGDDDLRELIQEFQLRGLLVEPQPEAFARLEATYADQPQVWLLRAAIDRTPGTRTLYRPAGGDSMVASFDPQHLSRHGIAAADIVGEPVPCHTIQSALATAGLEQVDLIQIDAEGYDDTIIQSIDFRRVRPAILRFEYHHLGRTRADACLELLSSHGYRFLVEEKDVVAWRRADRSAIQAAA